MAVRWILPLVLTLCVFDQAGGIRMWHDSEVNCGVGHYPHYYCEISTVVFNATSGAFVYKSKPDRLDEFVGVSSIWKFEHHANLWVNEGDCEWYDQAHIFTFYFYHNSNYFHLHYDTMMPLYQALYAKNRYLGRVLLMPSVEEARLQPVNYDTHAFDDDSKYWVEALKVMAGEHDMLPMNRSLRDSGRLICFKKAFFGTTATKVLYRHHKFMDGFVNYVKDHLFIREAPLHRDGFKPRVALISRKGRRKILNEEELLDSVRDICDIDLLRFEELSFHQQVKSMQKYAVIAGMNGAGLMNTIYRQADSVAVQLVPYEAGVNHEEFKLVIEAKGRYLEWHNQHLHHHQPLNHDKHNQHPNTMVHADEFRELILEGLELSKTQHVPVLRGLSPGYDQKMKGKDEL